MDPDLVAAMDEDFDYDDPENELEDNFIELANAEGIEEEDNDAEYSDENCVSDDEERDEVGSLQGSKFSFDEEETKSRFTQYSMSSSVIRRNEQLTLLDDKFEKVCNEKYTLVLKTVKTSVVIVLQKELSGSALIQSVPYLLGQNF